MSYTIEDLKKAEEEQKRWEEAFANDSGNNPNKYRSQIRNAVARVRLVESELKQVGVIPMSDAEKLTAELDKLHPNFKSRFVVIHKGNCYQIRYFPVEFSRSGKSVTKWGHKWILFRKGPFRKAP